CGMAPLEASRAGTPLCAPTPASLCISMASGPRRRGARWAISPCSTRIPRPPFTGPWLRAAVCIRITDAEGRTMRFAYPGWLWLLVLVPLPWLLERMRPKITWPGFEGLPTRRAWGWITMRALPAWLRGLAIGTLALALARPQSIGGATRIAGQGVAIVVALDQSSSMNAKDFP